jgi:hypothetical protein
MSLEASFTVWYQVRLLEMHCIATFVLFNVSPTASSVTLRVTEKDSGSLRLVVSKTKSAIELWPVSSLKMTSLQNKIQSFLRCCHKDQFRSVEALVA